MARNLEAKTMSRWYLTIIPLLPFAVWIGFAIAGASLLLGDIRFKFPDLAVEHSRHDLCFAWTGGLFGGPIALAVAWFSSGHQLRWANPFRDQRYAPKESEAMKHGRATIPFGKFKGVRIRLLPDDYLSFLTSIAIMQDPRWRWLKDSVLSELRFRGLRADLADTPDIPGANDSALQEFLREPSHQTAQLQLPDVPPRPRRAIAFK